MPFQMAYFRFRFSIKCVINGCSGYYTQTQKSPEGSGQPAAIHCFLIQNFGLLIGLKKFLTSSFGNGLIDVAK